MRTVILILIAVSGAMLSPYADAKNCKKGIPCGNTCIAANKVCRIGSPSSTADPSGRSVAPAQSAAQASAAGRARGQSSKSVPWVASLSDGVYFRGGCSAAIDLAPGNRRHFDTEAAAKSAGYRRSSVPGC